MDNQDKIFEKIKNAAQKDEEKDFAAFEKVWSRVEEKLDKKEDKKAIVLWKKLAIAASLLLFVSLGYQFLKSDSDLTIPKESKENPVVSTEKQDTNTTEKPSEKIKPEASSILKKQIEKQTTVAISDNKKSKKIAIVTANSEVEIKEKSRNYKKEIVANNQKNDVLVLAENNPSARVTSTYNEATRTISGIVTDENNSPIPAVSIQIKGKIKGTLSDSNGEFKLEAEKGDQLVFSYIGYENSYAIVRENDKINMKLVNNSMALNEVVVVGYGTQKKTSMTGSVASIKNSQSIVVNNVNNSGLMNINKRDNMPNRVVTTADLEKAKPAYITQALQGKVAGLQIESKLKRETSRTENKIVIRGNATITTTNEPLYIVDGVPVNTDLSAINPNNIEKIDVLKDASSTAIYGNRGANGVILITTKNGTYKNLSPKQLERKLKKLDKQKKTELKVLPPKSIEVSQEDYESFVENQFESPKNAPLSTFSIDVDNASYTNVRRFINNGQVVPKDAVRVEEMMNFFKYKYPQPQDTYPFSINTEYSDCPWNPKHQLLKIGLQGKDIPTESLAASNLVFLIDVSGSMSQANKLPLLKQSLKILVNQLRKKDKVSLVVYAGAAGMVLPPTAGDKKETIIEALEKLNAGGSTAGGAGIELAYKLAQENFIKGGNNRVILATDGDFNVGASSYTDMQTLIEEKRKSGVFLTCLGYGMGNYKDSKMETLSNKGNGNYAYIDNIQEANRFLGKEFKGSMFAIAKDVKIQIEFNPKHVQAYRLIGYENRKLRPEDFVNDAIDAGELGSGHSVTALYEIIPTGVKSDFSNNLPDLKYTKTNSTDNDYSGDLATIKFRYKKPDGDKSIEMVKVIDNKSVPLNDSSADFKFTTAVAWFGLKLRDSNLVPNKETEKIKNLAKEGLSNDDDGYKAEFIRLIETVK